LANVNFRGSSQRRRVEKRAVSSTAKSTGDVSDEDEVESETEEEDQKEKKKKRRKGKKSSVVTPETGMGGRGETANARAAREEVRRRLPNAGLVSAQVSPVHPERVFCC
jgi:hypothetical protein